MLVVGTGNTVTESPGQDGKRILTTTSPCSIDAAGGVTQCGLVFFKDKQQRNPREMAMFRGRIEDYVTRCASCPYASK